MKRIGTVHWISGPVVKARLSAPVGLMEQVWVGELGLAGEVGRGLDELFDMPTHNARS